MIQFVSINQAGLVRFLCLIYCGGAASCPPEQLVFLPGCQASHHLETSVSRCIVWAPCEQPWVGPRPFGPYRGQLHQEAPKPPLAAHSSKAGWDAARFHG